MTEPKFKTYLVWFGKATYQSDNAMDETRVYGRSLIRGALMFNDLDLLEDPWEKKKPPSFPDGL